MRCIALVLTCLVAAGCAGPARPDVTLTVFSDERVIAVASADHPGRGAGCRASLSAEPGDVFAWAIDWTDPPRPRETPLASAATATKYDEERAKHPQVRDSFRASGTIRLLGDGAVVVAEETLPGRPVRRVVLRRGTGADAPRPAVRVGVARVPGPVVGADALTGDAAQRLLDGGGIVGEWGVAGGVGSPVTELESSRDEDYLQDLDIEIGQDCFLTAPIVGVARSGVRISADRRAIQVVARDRPRFTSFTTTLGAFTDPVAIDIPEHCEAVAHLPARVAALRTPARSAAGGWTALYVVPQVQGEVRGAGPRSGPSRELHLP